MHCVTLPLQRYPWCSFMNILTSFFICKEMNFIAIERLNKYFIQNAVCEQSRTAIFFWKFSISCSLHEVKIGFLASEYEEEIEKHALSNSKHWNTIKIHSELNGLCGFLGHRFHPCPWGCSQISKSVLSYTNISFPGGSDDKDYTFNARDPEFDP